MPAASSIRAGAAYVELFVKDSRLVKGLRGAQAKLSAFGSSVQAIGTKLLTFGAGLGAPLLASLKLFASMGDQLDKMSGRTGVSVEALSALGFAAEQTGASLEILEKGFAGLSRTYLEAQRGSAIAIDALSRIGLTIKDLEGLSPDEQFEKVANGLASISDESVRGAAAQLIFGRAGRQLLPLLRSSQGGIQKLREEARALGITMSREDTTAAAELTDAMNRVWRQVKQTAATIGGAIAGPFIKLLDLTTKVLVRVINWTKANRGLVLTIAAVSAGLVAAGAVLITVGLGLKILAAALGGMAALITALVSPIGLVVAGLAALAAYLVTTTDIGQRALAWLGAKFAELRDTAMTAFQGIGDALAAGDISLAAKILWLTLKMEWQKGINFLNKHWQEWKAFFLRVFNEAVFSLAGVFTDAWAGLQVAWVESVGFMADAWIIFTASLTKGWRTAQNVISKGMLRLMKLFDDSIDVEGASQILDQDLASANRQTNEQVNRTIVEREQNRLGRRREIEQDRQGAQSAIDDMRVEEERKLAKAQSAALDESQHALDEARQEWRDAIDQAAKKREEAKAGDVPSPAQKFQSELDGLDEELAGTEKRTVGVKGTFSALAAAQGLGTGDAADRTATATESIDVNMRKLLVEVQRGGAAFE